ncbi:MAG: Cell envelope-associated transcriptional attenuator LytR-CpsA-Psr, subfamily A1 [uncultured Nocardioidaceae bacterium]|uniref:Cell envelope-associated transcriptional attenuator LytR-CpsA-Psr, subfamily A1 n=1 Tax=uncultured Nocardioidaceae bacterium TaxID=253824 RepID=A0A6J4MKE1_9ACTN|nr:MAG: Cell envelope-associated transcriptional attenuator LytR-CpsA-Psr, subfamily A1 [uncultured Nocardioidaceae bacterium]
MSGGSVSGRAGRLGRVRRLVALAVVLAVTVLVVPPAALREAPASLVKVESAQGVDHEPHVLWVLLLGSDARPGTPVLRGFADAVQLVGINTETGAATAIGIPRDSYVEIPGHGRNKINTSMVIGGPQLMARSVANMVGIAPDYVFTTGFMGFIELIKSIGGITVTSQHAFTDPLMPGGFRVGRNELRRGVQALVFTRTRKSLPRGDFDRSANQQRALRGILAKVRGNVDKPGFIERGVLSVVRNLDTNLPPSELFRLAHAATRVEPGRFRSCVITGGVGYVGAASVVFPDIAQARSIARRARPDATLEGGC